MTDYDLTALERLDANMSHEDRRRMLAAVPTLLAEVRRLRTEAGAWQAHAQAEAQAHLATTKRLIEIEAALTATRADAAHLRHLLERTTP